MVSKKVLMWLSYNMKKKLNYGSFNKNQPLGYKVPVVEETPMSYIKETPKCVYIMLFN